MARMPGAVWKPLPRPSSARMARYDLVIVHTMAGSLAGTDSYFRKLTNGVNSHFGTGGYGEIIQWVDTAVRSGASGAGNHRSISIENADMGPGFPSWNTRDASAVPAFTPQQIEANARICAWAHLEHGVPLVQADTSRPNARGIGFHRLGCDPYRVSDGEKWSSAYGKLCPAPRRIAQIPQIITRAQQIVNGADIEELDMSARDDIVSRQDERIIPALQRIEAAAGQLISVAGRPLEAETRLSAQLAAQSELIRQLATAQGTDIDMDRVEAVVEKGVADAIAGITTTVEFKPEA